MGGKWSLFLKYVIEEGILSTIGILPRFEVDLIIRIAMP
jgi:hypothetical protein